jgi:hypothetical protein
MERQLASAILAASVYFVLIGAGSIVAALLLLDHTRSSDLTRVAALSLAGGALGATVRSLYEVIESLERGLWELADGTIVERSLRRRDRVRETFVTDRRRGRSNAGVQADQQTPGEEGEPAPVPPHESEHADERAQEEDEATEARLLGLTSAEYALLRKVEKGAVEARAFGLLDLPWLILLPFLGAALGLVSFAALVGGFLVASGSSSTSYSPAGLLFVSALAGMFAPNFVASLARAADAIFGKMGQPPEPPEARSS